jgi:hypothetical protein
LRSLRLEGDFRGRTGSGCRSEALTVRNRPEVAGMSRSSTGGKLGSKGGGSTGGRDEGGRTRRWAAVQQGRLWPRASASRQQCRARRASGVWVVRQR